MAKISDLLSPGAMRKLRSLFLRSRHVVEGARAGQHASPLKGVSIEFADYREYVKGDNLRNLDWKVFGRTERYYVKQYEEETNLRVNVLIDASGSMAFQSGKNPTKYTYACRLAAAVGYLVTQQQDSLGLAIYDHEVREEIAPRSGGRHLQLFLERLMAHRPEGRTDTGRALHVLAERLVRRGLILLLTDMFDDPDAVFRAIAHFRKKMHDVILLHILDPLELDFSLEQRVELIDMETEEKIELDPTLARAAYKEELQRFVENCRSRCATLNVDYRLVSTEDSFEEFLRQYLAERRRLGL